MILILGSKGMLGGQLMKVFGSEAVGWDREDFDITQFKDLRFKIERLAPRPTAIINCVAYNDVDGAEDNNDIAFKLNSEAVGELAKICKELDTPLVHFSTNYVFESYGSTDSTDFTENQINGEFAESYEPYPVSVYAKSKYKGELEVQKNCNKYYIVRTAVIFGPKGESSNSKKSFVELMLDLSEKNKNVKAVEDEINSITYSVDLASQVKVLLDQAYPYGIYHITNSGYASWYEFAKEIFTITKNEINLVPVPSSEFPRKASRPKKSVLINTKLPQLRSWQSALAEYIKPNISYLKL